MRVGRYRVLGRLAAGESSDTLLARAEDASGPEHLVVLRQVLRQVHEDPSLQNTLALETAAYSRLAHPAVVRLYELFTDSGRLMMAFEHIDAASLRELLSALEQRQRGLSDFAAIYLVWRVLSALSAAHSAKDPSGKPAPIVHRNVNPATILVPVDGEVKLAEFGIAKFSGLFGTQVMDTKGTPGYTAPEQAKGQAATPKGDVYSACLILWELLAHRRAIVAAGPAHWDMVRAMAEPNFPSLSSLRPELPKELLAAVARGLESAPDRRDIDARKLCDVLASSSNLNRGRQELIVEMTSLRQPPASTTPPPPPSPQTGQATGTGRSPATGPLAANARPLAAAATPSPANARAPEPPAALRPQAAATATPSGGPMALSPSPSSTPPAAPKRKVPGWVVIAAVVQLVLLAAVAVIAAKRLFGGKDTTPASAGSPPEIAASATAANEATSAALPAQSKDPSTTTTQSDAANRTASSSTGAPAPTKPSSTIPSSKASTASSPKEPSSAFDSGSAPYSESGTLNVLGDNVGHRVWLDGRLVGDAPQSILVKCGAHSIRVGREGTEQHVSVPCGGAVDVR